MDNVYRRNHEMPYIADGAVTSQQRQIGLERLIAMGSYPETRGYHIYKKNIDFCIRNPYNNQR